MTLRLRADIGNHLLADLICWPIHQASGHGFYGLWGSTDPCGQIVLEHESACDPHACTSSKSIQPSLPVLSGRGRMISLCWPSTAAPVVEFYLTTTMLSIWPLTAALTVQNLSEPFIHGVSFLNPLEAQNPMDERQDTVRGSRQSTRKPFYSPL